MNPGHLGGSVVYEFESQVRPSVIHAEPASDPLSTPCLCPSPVCVLSLSLSLSKKMLSPRDTWMAQSVEHSTLNFGSGHEIKPYVGLRAEHGACLRFSLSLSLSPLLPLSQGALSFSLKIEKKCLIPEGLIIDVSLVTVEARRQWDVIFKVLKEKSQQILYPAKLSFKKEDKIKIQINKN